MLSNSIDLSILIPCKNEAQFVLSCLNSIEGINYPIERIEVLIGIDACSDASQQLCEEFASTSNLNVSVINLDDYVSSLQYKSRVLDALIEKANGEYLYLLDADSELSSTLDFNAIIHNSDADLVYCGNVANGKHFVQRWQSIDWFWFHLLNYSLRPLTGIQSIMGNNLFLKKEVYQAVGGYQQLGISRVEDLQLFHALRKEGYKVDLHFDEFSINQTKAEATWRAVYRQRLRWLEGFKYLRLSTFALTVLALVVIGSGFVFPFVWGGLLLLFYLILFSKKNSLNRIVEHPVRNLDILVYPFVAMVFYLFLPFASLLVSKKWK